MGKTKKSEYVWRVTNTKAEGITLAFGPELSEAPFSDDAKIHLLGKSLIRLGTRLMGSTTTDDDDAEGEAEWEDEN